MTQYLRVRRRRNAQTAAMIRLEGLWEGRKRSRDVSEEMEALADLNLQAGRKREAPAQIGGTAKRRSAVWRRVESENWKPDTCRVIDAVLEDSEEEEVQQGRSKRRKMSRRLTLVSTKNEDMSASQTEQQQQTTKGSIPKGGTAGYKILDPLERLVDNSLQQVMVGAKTPTEHWNLCRNDPSFMTNRQHYITWCNPEAGNILHLCALWNDPETAAQVLSRQGIDVETMTLAVDGEGRTPFQIATITGNQQVYEVLEAFGGDSTAADDAFVFDVYCLEDTGDNGVSSTNEHDQTETNQGKAPQVEAADDQITSCQLLGGVGYWDDSGELVLEVPDEHGDKHKMDAFNDEDEDSNSENWEGNDYPDYEEEDDSLVDDDDEEGLSFRHCSVSF